MLIEVRDEVLGDLRLTNQQALIEFVVGLYTDGRITLGRAAAIAGWPQADFQQELGRRGIIMHYDVEDLQNDLDTLASLRER